MASSVKIAAQFRVPPEFQYSDLKLFFAECINSGENTFHLYMFCVGHHNVYQYEICLDMLEERSRNESNDVDEEDKMDVESENCFAENLLLCSLEKKNKKLNVTPKECFVFPAPVLDIGGQGSDVLVATSEGIYGFPSSTSISSDVFNTSDEDIFSALLDADENSEECFTSKRKKPIVLDKKLLKLRKCDISAFVSYFNKVITCVNDTMQNLWRIEVLEFNDVNKEKLDPLVMFCTPNIQFRPINHGKPNSDAFLDPFEDNIFLNTLGDHTAVMKCIEVKNDSFSSYSRCTLKKETFVALFGGETFLLNSPVILLGTPDGRILWWPVKWWPQKACERPGFLCNLEQPVCNIFTSYISSQIAGALENDDCLIIVGKLGKIIIATANHAESEAVCFSVQYISSPVFTCIRYQMGLLHNSSDGQLWYSELKPKMEASKDVEVKSHQLPFVGILDIYTYEQMCDDIICLTLDGSLITIPESIISTPDHLAMHADTGEIEDLLKSIYRCSDELQEKQLLSKKQQNVLTELAAASDLAFGVSTKVTVSCTGEEVKGHSDIYLLSVEYQNMTCLNLSPEWWHLIVTVKEEFSGKETKAVSKSCPLSQGIVVQLLLKVHFMENMSAFCFPLKLECGLQLILPKTLSDPEFYTLKSKLPLYISVQTVPLSELWFLTKPGSGGPSRPVQMHSDYNNTSFLHSTIEEAVWTAAKSQITYDLHKSKKDIRSTMKANSPQEMQISVFTSTAMGILAKAGKTVENDADLPQSLLRFLVTMSKDVEGLINDNKLEVCCLGEPVSFHVEKQTDYLNIVISTENVHLLSGLRRAVTGFLVEALPDDTLSSQNQVQVSKQCLACAQSILAEVHQCLCKEKKNITEDEIKIYYRLREVISRNLPFL